MPINITYNKKECCGCNACVQICPKDCISLLDDKEGFWYPNVNLDICIDCNLCVKVCPEIHTNETRMPLKTLGVTNSNLSIVDKSSSAGVFTLLAEKVINQGGVVFGARMTSDFSGVVHDYTKTKDGLAPFRGSKYVQSNIGNNFKAAESFLKQDKIVLFSGTPCQIAGLKKYLKKEYENLISCDFICHGVPSPLVWKDYIRNFHEVEDVSFRDKTHGWKLFSMRVNSNTSNIIEPLNKNIFIKGFLKDIYLRPACYDCNFKSGRSQADITLGDFWGVECVNKAIYTDKGVSVVLLNSSKGVNYYSDLALLSTPVEYEDIVKFNPALVKSAIKPKGRNSFFDSYTSSDVEKHIITFVKVPLYKKGLLFTKRSIKFVLKKIGLYGTK